MTVQVQQASLTWTCGNAIAYIIALFEKSVTCSLSITDHAISPSLHDRSQACKFFALDTAIDEADLQDLQQAADSAICLRLPTRKVDRDDIIAI